MSFESVENLSQDDMYELYDDVIESPKYLASDWPVCLDVYCKDPSVAMPGGFTDINKLRYKKSVYAVTERGELAGRWVAEGDGYFHDKIVEACYPNIDHAAALVHYWHGFDSSGKCIVNR